MSVHRLKLNILPFRCFFVLSAQYGAVQFPRAFFSGQWSVVSGQWSVVSGQWSVVSGRWSVVGGRWSVVGGQNYCKTARI